MASSIKSLPLENVETELKKNNLIRTMKVQEKWNCVKSVATATVRLI